ncbi:hypothetical protein INR49_017825 [Caranx melampygus]|nr:hypothetical protein INR49_017825 [Caranx melampygus]
MLWPGAQQQPSGNGLRLLRELPVNFAIDYRGWTPPPNLPSPHHPVSLYAPPPHLSSPSVEMTLHWTVGLHRSECTAVMNFPRGHKNTPEGAPVSPCSPAVDAVT